MIDQKLVELTKTCAAQLKATTDTVESVALKADYAKAVLALFTADDEISVEYKIAIFDDLRKMMVEQFTVSLKGAIEGKGYWEDEDNNYFVYEAVVEGCFGPTIFDSINEFENFTPQRRRGDV